MASGDPFILYYPNGTAVPFGYQPAAGVNLVITSCNTAAATYVRFTANAGVATARYAAVGYGATPTNQAAMRTFINNTNYLWFQEAGITTYGMAVTGMEL